LRMNSLTGECWLLASGQNRWIKVRDTLKPVGIYNNRPLWEITWNAGGHPGQALPKDKGAALEQVCGPVS